MFGDWREEMQAATTVGEGTMAALQAY